MADISMCINDECPKKLKCKRYIAIPNKVWQSYFTTYPEAYDGKCKHFWKASKADKIRYEEYIKEEQKNGFTS